LWKHGGGKSHLLRSRAGDVSLPEILKKHGMYLKTSAHTNANEEEETHFAWGPVVAALQVKRLAELKK
jgi:hypothetical protein